LQLVYPSHYRKMSIKFWSGLRKIGFLCEVLLISHFTAPTAMLFLGGVNLMLALEWNRVRPITQQFACWEGGGNSRAVL
jgi:hypothetical protein